MANTCYNGVKFTETKDPLKKQKETGKLEIKLFPQKPTPLWISRVATFLYCTEIAGTSACYDGMGTKGADKANHNIRTLIGKGKLKSINCTPWIWEHSDMKVPSNDIMEEIYKKLIIKKIQFGQYSESGTEQE